MIRHGRAIFVELAAVVEAVRRVNDTVVQDNGGNVVDLSVY